MEMYEVGGIVRDDLLGLHSKDVDFTVVLDNGDFVTSGSKDPFNVMVQILRSKGFKIFLKTREHLTVRAQFPKEAGLADFQGRPVTADFVLARKEGVYTDGRRPDSVEPGTLYDDLARRDFTMNAIARDVEGSLIDPFNGREDIEAGIIRAVGDPMERLTEDALRAVRALRFSVTKGFEVESDLRVAMEHPDVLDSIVKKISDERIQSELSKMFRHNTIDSLYKLATFPVLTRAVFSGSVSLDATMKQKGRNNARKLAQAAR